MLLLYFLFRKMMTKYLRKYLLGQNIYFRATRQVTIITFTFGLVACHGT